MKIPQPNLFLSKEDFIVSWQVPFKKIGITVASFSFTGKVPVKRIRLLKQQDLLRWAGQEFLAA